MLAFAWIVAMVVGVALTAVWVTIPITLPAILKSAFIALVAAIAGLIAAGLYRLLTRTGEKETESEKKMPPVKRGGLNLNITGTKATAWTVTLLVLALLSPKYANLMLVITFIWFIFKVIQWTMTEAGKVRAKKWLRVIGITILLTITGAIVINVWTTSDEVTQVSKKRE